MSNFRPVDPRRTPVRHAFPVILRDRAPDPECQCLRQVLESDKTLRA